jgi:hypothetical protein
MRAVAKPIPSSRLLRGGIVPSARRHSDHGEWFVPVWIGSNFILFGSLAYWVLKSFATKQESRKQKGPDALGSGTLVEDRPVEGITYTETEVEEFRQRGLM